MDDQVDLEYFERISEVGTAWLSDFSRQGRVYGAYDPPLLDKPICDQIAAFMDKHNIGKSAYGKLMDQVGREQGVFLHRLYGHHLLYDFPIKNPENIIDFLVHEFSDLFTKGGWPIIPGEFLENAPEWLRRLTVTAGPCKNWNFINGFDLLAGTIAIFTASVDLRRAMTGKLTVESLGDFAKTLGVGIFELAISMSTANPLLLLGALLQLTAGVRGIFNNGDVIQMQKHQHGLSLTFALKNASLEAAQQALSLGRTLEDGSLRRSLQRASRRSFD